MLGLMYLGAAVLYFALMFFVVRAAWRAGRKNGGAVWKGLGFGLIGFSVVFLPAFWNVIPTAIAHRSACARDAGFRAFVDPGHWVATHQREVQGLHGVDPEAFSTSWKTPSGFTRYTYMGGLLAKDDRSTSEERFGLALGRLEMRIVDAATNQVMAQVVDYSLGSTEDARIWLTRRSCFPDDSNPITQLSAFNQQLKGALK